METGGPGPEQIEANRKFKKAIIDVVFTHCETFYLHCMPHPHLHVGKRGLIDREEQDGIILVFGPYSTRNLSMDDRYLFCDLQFNRWESVRIPFECIARVFDKGGQVIMQWATIMEVDEDEPARAAKTPGPTVAQTEPPADSRVIEVDFKNRKR